MMKLLKCCPKICHNNFLKMRKWQEEIADLQSLKLTAS